MGKYLIAKKPLELNDNERIASGREAIIYKKGKLVYKIYIDQFHPLVKNDPLEQQAAIQRIAELRLRLQHYPALPEQFFINPTTPIENLKNEVVGFVTPFFESKQLAFYLQKDFIDKNQIDWVTRKNIFRQIIELDKTSRQLNVVKGDGMSPRNLMVSPQGRVKGLDTLAYQWDKFLCMMLTDSVIDPRLLKPYSFDLAYPYDVGADIYAVYSLIFEGLLFTNPYSGIIPKKVREKDNIKDRRTERITVLDARVKYPDGLPHWSILPDDLLNKFFTVFTTDARSEFQPKDLELQWVICHTCGTEHARQVCPQCTQAPKPAIVSGIYQSKELKATLLFQTTGDVLFAKSNENLDLSIVIREGSEIRLDEITSKYYKNPRGVPAFQFDKLRIFQKNIIHSLENKLQPANLTLDRFEDTDAFDANSSHVFWVQNGVLLKDDYTFVTFKPSPVHTQPLVANNTQVWVNESIGFGWVRTPFAESFFLFNAKRGDNLHNIAKNGQYFHVLGGSLLDSAAYVSDKYVWLFCQIENKIEQIKFYLIDVKRAEIVQEQLFDRDSSVWSGHIKGKCAFNNLLFNPCDGGLTVVDANLKETEYPQTQNYINHRSNLFLAPTGVYSLNRRQGYLLELT